MTILASDVILDFFFQVSVSVNTTQRAVTASFVPRVSMVMLSPVLLTTASPARVLRTVDVSSSWMEALYVPTVPRDMLVRI